MKYYLMCKKVLGQKGFEKLVEDLTNQIIEKFSNSIILDKYMQILEYNIRLIMIISISNILGLDEGEKNTRILIKNEENFLLSSSLNEFEEKNKILINKITNLLK